MSRQTAVTTVDNPFNPFDDFRKWWLWDENHGYGTCEYLARLARVSDMLSDEENDREIERCIDEMIKFNPSLYRKVVLMEDAS